MIINPSDYFKSSFLIEITSEDRNFKKIETKATESKSSRTRLKAIMKEEKRLSIKNLCSISEFIRKSFFSGIEKNKKIEKKWLTKLRPIMTSRKNKRK